MSLNKPAARFQRVVGKRLSIQNNRVSMDENRKSGFYPDEPIDHLISAALQKWPNLGCLYTRKWSIKSAKFVDIYAPVENIGSEN